MGLALLSCREIGIVHRDIKPENTLVSYDGRFLLADFGMSREFDYENKMKHTTGLGTFQYTPSVEIEEGSYGSVDLFSLAVSTFYLAL